MATTPQDKDNLDHNIHLSMTFMKPELSQLFASSEPYHSVTVVAHKRQIFWVAFCLLQGQLTKSSIVK